MPLHSKQQEEANNLFGWLVGNWCGTNDQGASFCEQWIDKDGILKGRGYFFSQKNPKDTTFQESLELITIEDKFFYRVYLNSNTKPKDFVIVEKSDSGFVCQKPDNDFPQKIEYRNSQKFLMVILSDMENNKKVNFTLQRKDG